MMGAPCNTLFMRCLEYLADSDSDFLLAKEDFIKQKSTTKFNRQNLKDVDKRAYMYLGNSLAKAIQIMMSLPEMRDAVWHLEDSVKSSF